MEGKKSFFSLEEKNTYYEILEDTLIYFLMKLIPEKVCL